MAKPTFVFDVVLFFLLATLVSAQDAPSVQQPVENEISSDLIGRVIANQKKCDEALDVYERIERTETHKSAGDPPSAVKILRVIPTGTGFDRIPVGADGQPTDADAYRAELEKLVKALTWNIQDGRPQREAYEKAAKKRRERNELIDATRTAFIYTFVAREPRSDRLLAKYSIVPNPHFKATSRTEAIFAKVRGFIWIDESSAQLARVEGEVTDDIVIGLFLGKIYKGSHFMQERYELKPGLWLPTFSQYDFDGRKFLSNVSIHDRTFYSNYRFLGPPKVALTAIQEELSKTESSKLNPSGK